MFVDDWKDIILSCSNAYLLLNLGWKMSKTYSLKKVYDMTFMKQELTMTIMTKTSADNNSFHKSSVLFLKENSIIIKYQICSSNSLFNSMHFYILIIKIEVIIYAIIG